MARLYTIGHSTHELPRFLELLTTNGIEAVVDIRSLPRSHRNPQFNYESLPAELTRAGIAYRHEPRLGGLRHGQKDSPNTGSHNASFRGFADYMQTDDFRDAIEGLIAEAKAKRVAIMCAEALPWRCHRSLVADALTVRGIEVDHIHSNGHPKRHTITPFARAHGVMISYPS